MKGYGLALLILSLGIDSFAVIRVPQDQPTIQDGINAAKDGETVLVAPGTYYENIDFKGKAINVTSSGHAKSTIIDGGGVYQVVTFDSGETQASILSYFTIRNGLAAFSSPFSAGGISIGNSSPTISNNIVTENFGCGIGIYYGAPVIDNNTISYTTYAPPNTSTYCGPAQGSGILLYGQGSQYGLGSAQIIFNTIVHNVSSNGNGAGIYLWIGGAPVIENNIIAFNEGASSGGGITMQNSGAPLIVQNLIAQNAALLVGGGLDLEIPNDGSSATLVNNTIVGNTTGAGTETGPDVYLSGFFGLVAFWNNIIAGLSENAVVYCDPGYGAPSPQFNNNDVFSPKGGDYAGTCSGQTGQDGNISANPQFVNPYKRNLQLKGTSPAVNAGNNSAPDLPNSDLAGKHRIVGGVIDIGAYEYQGPRNR